MGGELNAKPQDQAREGGRRNFLSACSALAMLAGLLAGYGALAAHALRFLFPTKDPTAEAWQFVSTVKRFGNQSQCRAVRRKPISAGVVMQTFGQIGIVLWYGIGLGKRPE
jgi:hypothetical protein